MGMGKVMTTADAIQTFVDNGNFLFIGGYAGIRRIRIQHRIPLERMYRDAKAWGVAGGTIQMLKKESSA
jgi:hypothetical protein